MATKKLTLKDLEEDQIVKVQYWGYGRINQIEKSTSIAVEFELDESINADTCEVKVKLKNITEIVKNSKKLF